MIPQNSILVPWYKILYMIAMNRNRIRVNCDCLECKKRDRREAAGYFFATCILTAFGLFMVAVVFI